MSQPTLFHGEHLPSRIRYQQLFAYLPSIPRPPMRGRAGIDPNVMLRALLYRCLRRLPTLTDLRNALLENPSLAEAVGLDPFAAPPSIERFSQWLRSMPNETLQTVRRSLVTELIDSQAIRATVVAFDSTAVASPVRNNNLKTSMSDRFNKHRPPKSDPDSGLGAYRVYAGSGPQKVRYFWGYRNHAIVDFDTELPMAEETHPANRHEIHSAIPLLEACTQLGAANIEVVCGDSAYDAERLLAYIIEELHAQPVIAANARYQPSQEFRIQGKAVLCPANLPMHRKGRMTPKRTGITYTQYSCPLHYNASMRHRYLFCPANHPKFLSQKGCNFLLRHTPSYRSQIPYGSAMFAAYYKKRTSVERTFARLLSVTMQTPTVRGLPAIRNHCTIAHIAVLLVATAAQATGHPDKLAFVRSFVPNFMAQP